MNGQPVLYTNGMVMKDSSTHKDTTYLSADVVGFLVDFLGHGNPQVASFTGYAFNFNTAPASTSASK